MMDNEWPLPERRFHKTLLQRLKECPLPSLAGKLLSFIIFNYKILQEVIFNLKIS